MSRHLNARHGVQVQDQELVLLEDKGLRFRPA